MAGSMITLFGITFNIFGAILAAFTLLFLYALWRRQRAGTLDWADMLTRDGTKISATKVLQLVGGVVATWVVVQLTLNDKLTWEMLALYLTYVASIDGFSKFIMARYGAARSDDSAVAFPPQQPPQQLPPNYPPHQ